MVKVEDMTVGTCFVRNEMDLPYLPPAYSSILDKAVEDSTSHRMHTALKYVAMHPVKLHAGQSNLPNGELGRFFSPLPVSIPEMLGGKIHTTTV